MSYKVKFLDAASRDALKLRHEEPKSFANRLVYKIYNDVVIVEVVSAYGHYGDK